MYTIHTPYTTPHQEVLSLIVDGSYWSLGGHSLLQSPGYISQPLSEFIFTGFVGLGGGEGEREKGREGKRGRGRGMGGGGGDNMLLTSVNCHLWTM